MYSLEKLDSFTLPLPSANHTHDGKGKWSLSATKNLDASPHRLLVTTDAIFIAFDNSLQIVKGLINYKCNLKKRKEFQIFSFQQIQVNG